MNPNKALWEKGDFTRIAATMRESGEALSAPWGQKRTQGSGCRGCGDGTTAVGGNLVGTFWRRISPAICRGRNRRAQALGRQILGFRKVMPRIHRGEGQDVRSRG